MFWTLNELTKQLTIGLTQAKNQGPEHQNFQLSKASKTLTSGDVITFNIGPNCFIFEALKCASSAR